jgi:hypothetical protein
MRTARGVCVYVGGVGLGVGGRMTKRAVAARDGAPTASVLEAIVSLSVSRTMDTHTHTHTHAQTQTPSLTRRCRGPHIHMHTVTHCYINTGGGEGAHTDHEDEVLHAERVDGHVAQVLVGAHVVHADTPLAQALGAALLQQHRR